MFMRCHEQELWGLVVCLWRIFQDMCNYKTLILTWLGIQLHHLWMESFSQALSPY